MMAFERLEPFGALADEFRIGQVAAIVANVNRDAKTCPEPFTADDFMPALRRARIPREEAYSVRGEDLTPDEHTALLDATLFGRLH